jgi:pimeloyl-ACP methyl ester carboxylesterase
MYLQQWQAMGTRVQLGVDDAFVVDTPSKGPVQGPPLMVIHGFPTSSIDWAPVLAALSANRRVVLFDLPGFGLSAKPDRRYDIAASADAAQRLIEHLELIELDLVTHDMGDTVGGEILARDLEGALTVADEPVQIRRRVVTNGSIYLDMAELTDGQHALWSAPDEILPAEAAPSVEMLEFSLTATLAPAQSPSSNPDPADVRAAAEAVAHGEGTRLLPRLIRYLDDRRDSEDRYTGAIESHPTPLGIVWGDADPIAVIDMARHLAARRSDARLTELAGVGHYPMIEAPDAFAAAVLAHLDD